MALPATTQTTSDGSCCCGDCYEDAPETFCLTLDVDCAGWAGEEVTVTKTGGTTLPWCSGTFVRYVGTIGNPCGSLNSIEAYVSCVESGLPTGYAWVWIYNTGLVFPQGPCRNFGTDISISCVPNGATAPVYDLYYLSNGGITGPDCIDVCDCGSFDFIAGTVTFSAGPCGGAFAATAETPARKPLPFLPPQCAHLGGKVPGAPCGSSARRCEFFGDVTTRFRTCAGADRSCVGCPAYRAVKDS